MKLVNKVRLGILQGVFLACFSCSVYTITGQSLDVLDIPLSSGDKIYQNAWVGGLIAPQFNQVELNDDDKLDLLVFDRQGNVLLPFLNVGDIGESKYDYAPAYRELFPDTKQWIKLRDYNNDGIQDIFKSPVASGIPGVEVWKGKRVDGTLSFDLVEFNQGSFDIIYFPIGDGFTQIYVSVIDLPEIVDVDNDGDLDILSFDPSGGQVSFYKNIAVEEGLPLDSLKFILEDACFGKFRESGFSEDVSLSSDGSSCGTSLMEDDIQVRHSGSTIAAFDENGDTLIDLFLGDLTYNGIVQLINGGNADEAWFTNSEVRFPEYDTPVAIEVFNAAFYMDLNNDNLIDLVVAPNEDNALQNSDHIWFYQNQGSNESSNFSLQKQDFLVDEVFDIGSDASPTFIDVDQDGLIDIVVGTSGYREYNSFQARLYYLRNVGTVTSPQFEVEDEDYLNMSRFSENSFNLAPTFGDLDGDEDLDLLVGDDKGFLYYFENIAGPDIAMAFDNPVYQYQDIKVGQHVKPIIVDMNKDGLADLIIGERNFNESNGVIGSINYLQNKGSIGDPIFSEIDDEVFGGVNTKNINFINNYSSPNYYQNGGQDLLFVGAESGELAIYTDVQENLEGSFTQLHSDFGNLNIGHRITPAVADINNDGLLDILLGNRRGGLTFYGTQLVNKLVSNNPEPQILNVKIGPSPTPDLVYINSQENVTIDFQLFDNSGRKLMQGSFRKNHQLSLRDLIDGTYFLKLSSSNGDAAKKLLKIKD